MSTITRTMTVDEFFRAASRLGRCELIDGEVIMMSPAGGRHGNLAGRMHYFISQHVYANELGEVYSAETGFLLSRDPPTVRAPDVAYIHKSRVAAADTPKFIPIPPDLCVEVLSPDDRASEVMEKVNDWLDFGVQQVWVVDPATKSVIVYEPGGRAHVFHEHQTLTAGDLLPGFSLRLSELFA